MMAKRTDGNQREIMDAFRKLGATVLDCHELGRGVPDLLVFYKGETYLVEVKASIKSTYTPAELEFLTHWPGRIETVRSVEDVIKLLTPESAPR